MEALKSFENLSNNDKIRFFESLRSLSEVASTTNEDETSETSNSERSNLSAFLESLRKASDESDQETSPKRKQITLDNWLFKRDSGSSPKKKVEHSPTKSAAQSSVTSYSSNMSEVSSHFEHNVIKNCEVQISLNNACSESKKSKKSCLVVGRSETNVNASTKNVHADSFREVETPKSRNEKDKSRRSKRKASELSPIEEMSESNAKHFKSTEIQGVPDITDHKISDKTQNELAGTSDRLTLEQEGNNNIDKSLEKNYNQSTKRKNSKLPQSVRINNIITEQKESEDGVSNVEQFKNKKKVIRDISDIDKILDSTLNEPHDSSSMSNVKQKENSNMDISLEKKNCNRRTKTKNSKSDKVNKCITKQTEFSQEIPGTVANIKVYELSPKARDGINNVKRFKSTENQVIPDITDPDNIPDGTLNEPHGSSGTLTVEQKGNSNIDNSLEKKNSYQRLKKNNSKSSQSVKIHNNCTVPVESIKEMPDTVTNKNEPPSKTLTSVQSDYEAFCVLKNKCAKIGLSIMDILHHKKIQTLLNGKINFSDDALVFIGTFETQAKVLPVVHLAKSKKILQEQLSELKK